MGNIYIAVKIFFDSLGIDYIIPPQNNKLSLQLGSNISPEEMCLPFKIMMGNYTQSIQLGANTIVIVGSCGPCRFGEYGELQMRLLNKVGHDVKFVLLDPTWDSKSNEDSRIIGIHELLESLRLTKGVIIPKLLKAIHIMNIVDEMESYLLLNSPYEINNGVLKSIYHNGINEVFHENDPHIAYKHLKSIRNIMYNIPLDKNKKVLKIALIGEIYTLIDNFSNLDIEDKLMKLGVSITRNMTPTWWLKDTILKVIKLNGMDTKRYSKDYLPHWVGGHGRECIAESIMAHRHGYNGAIQVFPLGCMPEIVSKAILPSISKDNNFPIMSLVVDEMTGEGGYITRIEAFVDLLERRENLCTI